MTADEQIENSSAMHVCKCVHLTHGQAKGTLINSSQWHQSRTPTECNYLGHSLEVTGPDGGCFLLESFCPWLFCQAAQKQQQAQLHLPSETEQGITLAGSQLLSLLIFYTAVQGSPHFLHRLTMHSNTLDQTNPASTSRPPPPIAMLYITKQDPCPRIQQDCCIWLIAHEALTPCWLLLLSASWAFPLMACGHAGGEWLHNCHAFFISF